MEDTFIQLPLHLDPTSKAITVPSASSNKAHQDELQALNILHRSLLSLDTAVPPPPLPVNPKRTAQLTKMREQGNASFRKGNNTEAIKLYTYGIEMALGRPPWEPAALVKDEVSAMYSNRAQAYMGMQCWAEGMVDADTSVEMKKIGNAKAWWRKGRCLVEMGRVEEAKEWVGRALEFEGNESDLVGLMKEIEGVMVKKQGRSQVR